MNKNIREPKPQAFLDLSSIDWKRAEESLNTLGYSHTSQVVWPKACLELRQMYSNEKLFRKRIVMEHHNFGIGDYAYFAEPLPKLVLTLRNELYERLAPIANRMMHAIRLKHAYPPTLMQFRKLCHAVGQTKPTPLMLHYEAQGFNCLHRDLYGPTVFPLQAMVMLSRKNEEFEGGEFVLVENRPRQQSRATVLTPNLGDLIIFPVSDRAVPGKREMLRASMRHGVSRIKKGKRWTLGIIFHDAK
ncbi:MAG: 2OG-Fe(II) oxygenase [Nitrospirota bacterium]|nr:MAG: 2OG-Fe(II) oxygenase [Nitrospirota bacterium]